MKTAVHAPPPIPPARPLPEPPFAEAAGRPPGSVPVPALELPPAPWETLRRLARRAAVSPPGRAA